MKRFIGLLVFLMVPALVWASPTTEPSVEPSGAPSGTAVVLVFPFKQMGDPTAHPWVGGGINENLISEASRDSSVLTRTADQPMANSDSASALRIAREKGASIAVFGSYQVSGDQLRVDGQVVNVNSEHQLGALQASGQFRDLFTIEDSLTAQLKAALPQENGNMPVVGYGQPSQSADANVAGGGEAVYPYQPQGAPVDQGVAQTQTYQYPYAGDGNSYAAGPAYPDYGYAYSYPYGYGWGGYPFIIYGGSGFGRGFNRGGWFRGGFRGGFNNGFRGGIGFNNGGGFRGSVGFGAARSFGSMGGGHFGDGGGHR